jgi:hypothetical protein
MPTASTSQVLGNNEVLNLTLLIFIRRVLSGEFIIVNKHLLKDRFNWDLEQDMKNGSSQQMVPSRISIIFLLILKNYTKLFGRSNKEA